MDIFCVDDGWDDYIQHDRAAREMTAIVISYEQTFTNEHMGSNHDL